jgi:Protein of unknown function (DUF2931)
MEIIVLISGRGSRLRSSIRLKILKTTNTMKKAKKTILLCTIILCNITMSSCMEKKYRWSGNTSSPQEYPTEVYSGFLGNYGFSEMGGFDNSGWGSSTSGMSNITAPAPETLEITWRSFVENKFYTGSWTLPKAKIEALFDAGTGFVFEDGEKETYNTIQIGLAPGGMVVIWLSADAGSVQVEIGRYQAHETTIDSKTVYDNAKYMFEKDYVNFILKDSMTMRPDILARVTHYGYPKPSVYEEYRELYLWKPNLILPDGSTLIKFNNKMCNGEKEYTDRINNFSKFHEDFPILKDRAIPYEFEIVWKDKQGQRFISRISFTNDKNYWIKYLKGDFGNKNEMPLDFDQNQIRTVYKQLDKRVQIDLVIKLDPSIEDRTKRVASLYLKQGDKEFPLEEAVTRTGKY